MAFMLPQTKYFKESEFIGSIEKCDECQERKPHNSVTSGEGWTLCIECSPPEVGWYGRLSAPGYLDCTDWHGPFESEELALHEVMSFYEVDENGDSTDD